MAEVFLVQPLALPGSAKKKGDPKGIFKIFSVSCMRDFHFGTRFAILLDSVYN